MQITSWPFQDFMESAKVGASGDIGLQPFCKHGAITRPRNSSGSTNDTQRHLTAFLKPLCHGFE